MILIFSWINLKVFFYGCVVLILIEIGLLVMEKMNYEKYNYDNYEDDDKK